ncbi:MAG: sigma-70 family RNA polymerase sigma factor [Clostridia bacterium]|nr:sigma-70 family RNA polymerase sigma factor [Clostridia bacterium]
MLEHEQTMLLIGKAKQGDEEAKTILLQENMPLLKSIIRRYAGKNVEYDDLLQISSIGLLKAINNFSTEFNVRFSTYAVPMILGEVKRYLRDDGYIKVSRSVKSLASKINLYIDEYRKTNIAEPTIEQIAEQFDIEQTEVIFVMDSTKMPISLYDRNNSNDGKSLSVIDKLVEDNGDEDLIDRIILKTVINQLTDREKKIILLRYFRDLTQGEIAHQLGVSQVQISRLETKILEKIKKSFTD